ncbi:MAG TPA: ornithine cyclodeaminase family protein [Candidatus Dormibacteraeota bacterium]|nr:ornithine cyclodeaminase family protein [Candidatus Dormibacteraeota bacterium]
MKHFSRDDIFRVDPREVADAMAVALGMVSRGAAVAPIRAHIELGEGAGTFLISGVLTEFDLLTVKVINVRPGNPGSGLPRLQGALTIFKASTGVPIATLDAPAATEARTAACSALSMRLLGRSDASVLTVFGTGPQAAAHIRALSAECDLKEVRIVGKRLDVARELAASHPHARAVGHDRALRGAHAVVTATNTTSPLFSADAVEPGTHLMLVGSGSANAAEVEPALLGRAAAIRVDHRPSCLEESGEIVQAVAAGLIAQEAVRELGEVVIGRAPGRGTPDEITVYKSVGNGTQDAGLAALLLGVLARP